MSASNSNHSVVKGGRDQFNWNTVKSDKDRECYLGHSIMAPTGRWQEGKDLTWYAKNREHEQQIKSAEFRAAKKIEEDALMTALGIKVMPPPPSPAVPISTQKKSSTKRESISIKNEPMTPAIHNNSRDSKQHSQSKRHDSRKKDDRRRQRQLKATNSDEEKNDWSEDDDKSSTDDESEDKTKEAIQNNTMTEKELDEFLIDLVRKHGLKKVKRTLKSKKEKKKHKRQHSSSESESKHEHKKKSSHREDKSKSKKHHRTRSSSPMLGNDCSKHVRNHE